MQVFVSSIAITAESFSLLSSIWSKLYNNSRKSPFLSWEWQQNNLVGFYKNYTALVAKLDSEVIGLGLLSKQHLNGKDVLFLNRSGLAELDQTWIEYNDFLLHKDWENDARLALIDYLFKSVKFDEFVVGASLKRALAPYNLFFNRSRVEWCSQTYQVDLQTFNNKADFLDSLSSNTRYQIQRSEREYSKLGSALVEKAGSAEIALEWLEHAAPHHIKRWGNTRVGSGFENPHFVRFHKRLISGLFPAGKVELLRIKFGNSIIAFLYNLIVDNTVYFYLSANIYTDNTKHAKPGLVAHVLAIEEYIGRGFYKYDFMGGESQYKRSFATQGEPISITRFQRDNIYMRVENKLRALKQSFFSKTQNLFNDRRRLIITGGALNAEDKNPQYNKALVYQIEINSSEKPLLINKLDYMPERESNICASDTNIIFKSASLYKNLLYVPTETEIKVIDIRTMEQQETYSLPSFNDLHHVIRQNDRLFIANTGLDAVTELDLITKEVNHHLVLENTLTRPLDNIDYRQTASTKPHLAHPNFCFELNNEIWVTRCDFMDAVAINDKNKRLFIGDGLVHDGVVSGKYVYFTTVEGRIKVYDKATLRMHADVDVKIIAPEFQGWFRGICPIGQGSVLIAMSKPRKSKRGLSSKQQSTLLLVDIYLKQIIQIWDLGELGLDAVFSVIEVSEK